MATMTAEQFAEKHARRTTAAIPDMAAGIKAVTESPTAKAASKMAKLKANLIAAIDSGKMARGLNSVSLEDWRTKMLEKGINRVAEGIQAANGKVIKFAAKLLPFQEKLSTEVNKMADTTLEDSIARMTKWTRGMATFQKD
jgi:hypothetical protein